MARTPARLTAVAAAASAALALSPGPALAETRVAADPRRDATLVRYDEEGQFAGARVDPTERHSDIVRQTTSYGRHRLTVTVRLRELDLDRDGHYALDGRVGIDGHRMDYRVWLRPGDARFSWQQGRSVTMPGTPCRNRDVDLDVLEARRAVRISIPTVACLDDVPWVRSSTYVWSYAGLRSADPARLRRWIDGALTPGRLELRRPFGGMGARIRQG